jgi:hypothetical protein
MCQQSWRVLSLDPFVLPVLLIPDASVNFPLPLEVLCLDLLLPAIDESNATHIAG